MHDKLNELKTRLAEVDDLSSAAALLAWDQQTHMPPGGAEARGRQMATLQRLAHEKFTDEKSAICSKNSGRSGRIGPTTPMKRPCCV